MRGTRHIRHQPTFRRSAAGPTALKEGGRQIDAQPTRREPRRVVRKSPPCAVVRSSPYNDSLTGRAVAWCFPWSRDGYPGRMRGVLSLLGQSLTWTAVQNWRAGRRPLPAWAARGLADHIEARARPGLMLVAELRLGVR
jgi:hypothetical protein